jgi:hypothetical protein
MVTIQQFFVKQWGYCLLFCALNVRDNGQKMKPGEQRKYILSLHQPSNRFLYPTVRSILEDSTNEFLSFLSFISPPPPPSADNNFAIRRCK